MILAPDPCSNVFRAHGCTFDFDAFVAFFSSSKARALLIQLRQSQCLEVFINERLLMASKGYADKDDFERKVWLQTDTPFLHHPFFSHNRSSCLLLLMTMYSVHQHEMAMYMVGHPGWLQTVHHTIAN